MQAAAEKNTEPLKRHGQAESLGTKAGLISTLFGCWHRKLSRPFTYGKVSYRACLKCGARKRFDTETLTTSGAFYYPSEPLEGN